MSQVMVLVLVFSCLDTANSEMMFGAKHGNELPTGYPLHQTYPNRVNLSIVTNQKEGSSCSRNSC